MHKLGLQAMFLISPKRLLTQNPCLSELLEAWWSTLWAMTFVSAVCGNISSHYRENEALRCLIIDIETESLVQANSNMSKVSEMNSMIFPVWKLLVKLLAIERRLTMFQGWYIYFVQKNTLTIRPLSFISGSIYLPDNKRHCFPPHRYQGILRLTKTITNFEETF